MGRTISFVVNAGNDGRVWAIGPEEHSLLRAEPSVIARQRRRYNGSYVFHPESLPLFDPSVIVATSALTGRKTLSHSQGDRT